ncbi:hypothetical protein GYMLUDRAFT_49324 [Collybiopsis luxurians FD-317 M1]|uniref:CoA-transferase family III n=1 Tax=Collybiopsis luxurians FD-317 M1 TaxID=944289 RepID=A0A0D0CEL9_9AGAR|nr:hypothetical protein GYMLUDRAFT_49324 [Collybiopsis luxurians FD-317 M1]
MFAKVGACNSFKGALASKVILPRSLDVLHHYGRNGLRVPLQSFSTEVHTSDPLPLNGITVVSLEQAIAGPFCTRQLAELGARVIKIERRGEGDFARHYDTKVKGMASHFVWTNRSKESLALDLKDPQDMSVVKKLLERSDVLVQNLAPGATDRMGLSYDVLREYHPSLIVCNISGYGPDGPYRHKKAYDLLVQSEAGVLSVTGTESEPVKVGIAIADIASAMYAYSSILAALIKREKTGRGCKIDISMLESMVEWMGFPLYYAFEGADGLKPTGASHASIYPYGPFETGDGRSVMLSVQNEREWARFCIEVLGDASVAVDPRFCNSMLRSQHREVLKTIICDVFSLLTAGEAIERLEKAGIANASVNEMSQVWNHPQLKARRRWTEVETPVGRVTAPLPPGADSLEDVRMGPVPSVGEHNDAILAELGITDKK